MKKVIYIPNQKKNVFFDKGTPDFEQEEKSRKQLEKARSRNQK